MTSALHVWAAIIWRSLRRTLDDQVTTIAAGIAFFVLLATFPGLAAVISLVGLFAEPDRVHALLAAAPDVLPERTAQFIARQIDRLAAASLDSRALSLTPYVGFALLIWSTNKGTKALFRGLNMIYGQEERRGFLAFTLLTLGFTLGAIVFLVFAVGVVVILPFALALVGLDEDQRRMLALLRWPLLLVVVGGVAAVIYRFGPSRDWKSAGWRAVAAGSALAATLWLGGSMLFSWYISTFGGFAELYGSLAAVIGFLVWIWLSVTAVLVGAEFAAVIAAGVPDASPNDHWERR
jgi:membrane protein